MVMWVSAWFSNSQFKGGRIGFTKGGRNYFFFPGNISSAKYLGDHIKLRRRKEGKWVRPSLPEKLYRVKGVGQSQNLTTEKKVGILICHIFVYWGPTELWSSVSHRRVASVAQSAPNEAPSCSPFGKKKKYKDKYLAKHSSSKFSVSASSKVPVAWVFLHLINQKEKGEDAVCNGMFSI